MGLELTTDRDPPITSQTRYPLRHAASYSVTSTVSFVSLKNGIYFVCSFFGFLSFGYSASTLYFHMLSHIIYINSVL